MTMNIRTLIVSLSFFFLSPLSSPLQSQQRDSPITQHATGPFEVKTTPLDPAFKTDDNSLGRLSLEKQFHGDLEATQQRRKAHRWLPVKGSGAYVAIERASGTLHGRLGTFILHHSGTMSHGAFQLDVKVVPDWAPASSRASPAP
jgi:hypothetical protein